MSELKQSLRLERIENRAAKRMLDAHHPLGAGQAFTFALGIFWQGRCEGVLTFGNPISNLAVQRYGLRQCESFELRKMWLSDRPPANSESRILAIAARLIRKHYPLVKILLTYCGSEETASAYRAAGWIAQDANSYVREVLVDDKWYSIRDANRYRLTSRATEKKTESRRKFVLPLDASVAQRIERSPSKRETAGSDRPGRSISV